MYVFIFLLFDKILNFSDILEIGKEPSLLIFCSLTFKVQISVKCRIFLKHFFNVLNNKSSYQIVANFWLNGKHSKPILLLFFCDIVLYDLINVALFYKRKYA